MKYYMIKYGTARYCYTDAELAKVEYHNLYEYLYKRYGEPCYVCEDELDELNDFQAFQTPTGHEINISIIPCYMALNQKIEY